MPQLNILLCSLVLLTAFAYATSLTCYDCIGNLESDCAKGHPKYSKFCVPSNDLNPIVCFNFTVTGSKAINTAVIKGCGLVEESEDICDKVLTECHSCNEDLCN